MDWGNIAMLLWATLQNDLLLTLSNSIIGEERRKFEAEELDCSFVRFNSFTTRLQSSLLSIRNELCRKIHSRASFEGFPFPLPAALQIPRNHQPNFPSQSQEFLQFSS
jgi:hypothetical protein